MREKIELPWEDSADAIIAQLECLGLTIGEPVELKSYPCCRHWHISKPGERGVLELTHWPNGRRFWFKIAANRSADWIDAVLSKLRP